MASKTVTRILHEVADGSDSAVGRLIPLVYDELRALAESYLKQERAGHTLQATALVHEAYLRLVSQQDAQWRDRAHFFAVAAQTIRRVLLDHARGHLRAKRGGDRARVALDESIAWGGQPDLDIIALDEALQHLATLHKRHAQVVELRFFGGLTIKETAAVVGVSERTVNDDWRVAKSWLLRELDPSPTVPKG